MTEDKISHLQTTPFQSPDSQEIAGQSRPGMLIIKSLLRGRPFNSRVGRVGDFEKKFPASACRKKKIARSTNVIESLWEEKGKNILPTRLLEKKFLMTRNHPPPRQEFNGRALRKKNYLTY